MARITPAVVSAASTAMIVMTTNSSVRVKARREAGGWRLEEEGARGSGIGAGEVGSGQWSVGSEEWSACGARTGVLPPPASSLQPGTCHQPLTTSHFLSRHRPTLCFYSSVSWHIAPRALHIAARSSFSYGPQLHHTPLVPAAPRQQVVWATRAANLHIARAFFFFLWPTASPYASCACGTQTTSCLGHPLTPYPLSPNPYPLSPSLFSAQIGDELDQRHE